MRWRSTAVLMVLVLLVGALIIGLESGRDAQRTAGKRRRNLFDFNRHQVMTLFFESKAGGVFCSLEGDVWKVGSEEENLKRADTTLMEKMLAGLRSIEIADSITRDQLEARGFEFADYGFDEPQLEISVVDSRSREKWLVGKHTAVNRRLYVMKAGENIFYTVSDSLLDMIPGKAEVLRDRQLFPGWNADIRHLEIRSEKGFVQLVRDPQKGWRLMQPRSGQASGKEVARFLDALRRLQIKEVLADQVSDFSIYGLQDPSIRVVLAGSHGSSYTLHIGEAAAREGMVHARRGDEDSVVLVSAGLISFLDTTVESFRATQVFNISRAAISSIKVEFKKKRLLLQKEKGQAWSILVPLNWRAEQSQIEQFIDWFHGMAITRFNVQGPLQSERCRLVVGSNEEGVTNHVELVMVEDIDAPLIVHAPGDEAFHEVNRAQPTAGFFDVLSFKNRQVMDFKPDQVERVQRYVNGEINLNVRRNQEKTFEWDAESKEVLLDPPEFKRFLNTSAALRAVEFVESFPAQLNKYGLDVPQYMLSFYLVDTDSLGSVLLLGNETEYGFFAMLQGRDVVFIVDRKTVDILTANMVLETRSAEQTLPFRQEHQAR